MALKRRVAKDHTCTSVDPTVTHAPSSSGPEEKKRGAYALSLTSENFSSSFSPSYKCKSIHSRMADDAQFLEIEKVLRVRY